MEKFQGSLATRIGLSSHFLHQHVQGIMIILEEGNLYHPQCPHCGMVVPWAALNVRHPNTAQCSKGEEQNWRRLAAEEIQAIK